MTKLRSRSASRLTKAGIAAGGLTSLLLAGTAIPAFAAVPGTLSVSSGPSAGGNTVTMTTTTPAFTTASPVVEFQAVTASAQSCSTSYKAPAAITAATTTPYANTAGVIASPAAGSGGGPTRLTTSKIVIPVPSTVALASLNQTTAKFNICVYDGTTSSSTLLASAQYTIAAQPTLTTSTGISPISGPALGGNTITITGTGFISGATTVTIGGAAATNVSVNASGTILTATVPSHAPATNQQVAVTTTGGTVTNAAINGPSGTPGTLSGYTFSNGINVIPNTSPNTTNPTLDITGAGFGNLTWATDIDDATGISAPGSTSNGARIVLTDNAWAAANSTGFGAGGGQVFPSPSVFPTGQCGSILPISDGEVICTLNLTEKLTWASGSSKYVLSTSGAVPNGTYQITVANSDATTALLTTANNYSVTSSGGTFTVSPF